MNYFKEFGIPTAVLTIICVVVSAALSLTYAVTNPIIEENQRLEAMKALTEVFPLSQDFESKTEGLPEGVSELNIAKDGSGAVVQVNVPGYGGNISIMVGVGNDGVITGVKVLEATETQGLGSKVVDDSYTVQFAGKTDPEQVESIAGSTVTSNAVKKGISIAIDACAALKGA